MLFAGVLLSVLPLADSSGGLHTARELQGKKAAVFVFLATDCPISNSYLPELRRLNGEYSARGVLFYAVHSDPAVAAPEVSRHAREFAYPFPALMDSGQRLARALGVRSTPEVAVVSPQGAILYRGRIDDRNVDFGARKPRAAREDLRIALDEVLDGKEVSRPVTKAIGCAIPFPVEAKASSVTFARDVAPILYRRCAACHRPGEVAPFPLLTYNDAAKRAALIARVTASRYMPPWQPAPGYGEFQDDRRLSEAEISAFRAWADAGAPEGNLRDAPPVPKFPSGWQLGEPDLVLEMQKSFPVPADGPDQYRCFVVPMALDRDRYVRAIAFQPGDRPAVHHALLFQDMAHAARRLETAPGEGYPCFGAPGFLPVRGLGGWAPGGFPIRMAEDMAEVLHRGSDLVLQVHYHPTGKPGEDRSRVAFYFTDRPPRRHGMDVALGSSAIDIPPGERAYKVRDHFTLPVDVEAIGIIPHAHYICREMNGWAILPDGSKRWLIRIPDWNFDWQEQYRYASPVKLPAGTRLEMEFVYDNSAANPRNPYQPPRRVRYGPGSGDEMAGLHVQVVPDRESDIPELGQALWGKVMRALGGGIYRRP